MSVLYDDVTMTEDFEWTPAGDRFGDDGAPIPIPESAKCVSLGCTVSTPATITGTDGQAKLIGSGDWPSPPIFAHATCINESHRRYLGFKPSQASTATPTTVTTVASDAATKDPEQPVDDESK
jgi:hypothetical protein